MQNAQIIETQINKEWNIKMWDDTSHHVVTLAKQLRQAKSGNANIKDDH